MSDARVNAADIEDWTRQPRELMIHGDGTRISMLNWGRGPDVGKVIEVQPGKAYRVVERAPRQLSADYGGVMSRLEFVPGREIDA